MCDENPNGFLDLGGLLIQYGFWALFVVLQIGLGRVWTRTDFYTDKLKRPASPLLRPPPWLFGFVWSVLYFGQSVAAYMDVAHYSCGMYSAAVWLYVAYSVVSTAWTYVFFARSMIGPAFVVIITALALAVSTTSAYLYQWDAVGNWVSWWCFLPTAVWLCYASILNFAIWRLNPRGDDVETGCAQGGSASRLRPPANSSCTKPQNTVVSAIMSVIMSDTDD